MRWIRASLATKLFLSYLLVVLVGVTTLFIAVSALAPSFFVNAMQGMMNGQGMGGMMNGSSSTLEVTSA
jgi:hypothetical protein